MMNIRKGWLNIERVYREIVDGSRMPMDEIAVFGFLTLNDHR